jgi:hypothetical protein
LFCLRFLRHSIPANTRNHFSARSSILADGHRRTLGPHRAR